MSRIPQPEEMAAFFNQRASGYDAHMGSALAEPGIYYQELAQPIMSTDKPIEVLDLGSGTGLEISAILTAAPKAHLTCIDLSHKMLRLLKTKFPQDNVVAIQASYLEFDFGEVRYDAALSSMTLHHLLPNQKQHLYQKIFRALRPGAIYIEGDYIVQKEKMVRLLNEYTQNSDVVTKGNYHIDIPLSLPYQKTLLERAGFENISVIYAKDETVIVSARKIA